MNLSFIKKKNNISFLITHVPQESETVFPIINRLGKAKKKIFVVFYRKELFDYYEKNKIFKIIANQHNNIKIIFLRNYIHKLLFSIYIFFNSDEIFLGDGIKKNYEIFFSKLNIFFRRSFFIFRHSTGTLVKKNHSSRFINKEFNKKFVNLVSTEKCKENLKNNGYKKVIVTGEVYCDKNYLKLVNKNTLRFNNYILLFSYKSNFSFFKYFDKVNHYKIIVQFLKKYNKKKILLIKPHPSENIFEIKKILKILQFYNYKIINENSLSLATNAKAVISLGTSAGLLSFKNNIPTVNLFLSISSKKEERLEKSKSNSFLEGIPTVNNIQEIKKIFINFKKNIK